MATSVGFLLAMLLICEPVRSALVAPYALGEERQYRAEQGESNMRAETLMESGKA